MRKALLLPMISCLALVWTGCTLEKRHYQKGYHVEWLSHKVNSGEREIVRENDEKAAPIVTSNKDDSPSRFCENAEQFDSCLKQKVVLHGIKKINRKLCSPEEVTAEVVRAEGQLKQDEAFPIEPNFGPYLQAEKSRKFGIWTWLLTGSAIFLIGFAEVFAVISIFLLLVALVLAVLAISLGKSAKEEIMANGGNLYYLRRAMFGITLGWIYVGIAMGILLLAVATYFAILSLFAGL